MQKYSAIFLALLCVNLVASLELSPIDSSIMPSKSMHAELTSMLVEVEKTESPKTIKNFIEQVRGMMTKLEKDQETHKAIAKKMKGQCDNESAYRKTEIAAAKSSLSKSRAARGICRASLKSSRKDLPELEAALRMYQSELKKAIEHRAREKKMYEQRKRDFEQGIAFVEAFIKVVSKEFKGSFKTFSFVEHSEQLLRHVSKLGLIEEAVPVLLALATEVETEQDDFKANKYGYAANESLATKLKTTLNNLLFRLKADYLKNEQIEQAAINAFNILKNRLEKAISTLTKDIARTKKQIAAMEKCIVEEDRIIGSANNKFRRNDSLKTAAERMCAEFIKEFIHAYNARVEEIKVIREILKIIEKRFGTLPADLKVYLESVEKGWKQYRNDTEFKKFVEYRQTHLARSNHGRSLTKKKNLLKFF